MICIACNSQYITIGRVSDTRFRGLFAHSNVTGKFLRSRRRRKNHFSYYYFFLRI